MSAILVISPVIVRAANNPTANRHAGTASIDSSQPVRYPIQVLDAETGIAIEGATVRWQNVENDPPDHFDFSGSTGKDGRIILSLLPGRYAVETTANGYKPTCCRLVLQIAEGMSMPKVIENLTPLKLPGEVLDLNARQADNLAMIGGYVVDATTRRPIVGAQVKFQKTGATAQSDSGGFFSVQIPASPPNDSPSATVEGLDLDTLRAAAKGYKIYSLKNVELYGGDVRVLVIPMEPGSGITNADEGLPAAITGDSAGRQADYVPVKPSLPKALIDWMHSPQSMSNPPELVNPSNPLPLVASMSATGGSPIVPLPPQIVVGSGCTRVKVNGICRWSSCASSKAYDLETYVANGLPREWESG